MSTTQMYVHINVCTVLPAQKQTIHMCRPQTGGLCRVIVVALVSISMCLANDNGDQLTIRPITAVLPLVVSLLVCVYVCACVCLCVCVCVCVCV